MNDSLVISATYCGPPKSANGGYTAGMLAKYFDGDVEVTLRKPPPLDTPMSVEQSDGKLLLRDGDTLIAEAKPGGVEFSAPAPPSLEEASYAAEHYIGFQDHAFPGCFVCGPDRREGDGLRIFAGETPDKHMVASPWIPHASLVDESGKIAPEFIWCALDCPGSFALMRQLSKVVVLGRMTASIRQPIAPEDACVVIGWSKGKEGRKAYAGTALYNSEGSLCAVAHATWIEL